MEPPRLRCMVVVAEGPSRRVGANGLWIGRQRDCDIVATDPSVSRRHVLVRLIGEGVELVPLGKAPVELNGSAIENETLLADGDEIRLPGLVLRIEIELPDIDRDARPQFVLERRSNLTGEAIASFGVTHSPFVVGGGDDDDLIVRNWQPAAFMLHIAQDQLYVELREGLGEAEHDFLREGQLLPLSVGDRFTYEGELFVIGQSEGRVATTAVGGKTDLPTQVTIEILPRGGRLVFTVGGREHAVYLPDRRFDLMVALLRDYREGEFVTDDQLRSIVWPRRPEVSRPEINMLISRCRRDLVDAGLAGPRLIERAPGGGGTRVALSAGARVEILS
ncbi:MAG TPA: FHA domain-containing protein [Kofleriaceae bacterium]